MGVGLVLRLQQLLGGVGRRANWGIRRWWDECAREVSWCAGVLVCWYPDKEEAGSPKEGLGGRQVQEAAYTAGYKTSAR